jgi:hypothetical protein
MYWILSRDNDNKQQHIILNDLKCNKFIEPQHRYKGHIIGATDCDAEGTLNLVKVQKSDITICWSPSLYN